MSAEFDFIDQLRRRCPVRPPVEVGIGDDAAVLRHREATMEVVTTDMLMEGVDFLSTTATPAQMGRKSLAVNLSDIAAMGARPTAAFVSVALPRRHGRAFAEEFYQGLLELADAYGVTIAGGDTNSWDGPFVCSITVLGVPCGDRPILRSGAQAGDVLLVTGACGGSLAGRHLTFEPRLNEAALLVELAPIHAMIDISDGLAADTHHLLKASGVGAILDAASIPIHPDVSLQPSGKTPLERALADGEDFELAFCVAAADVSRLREQWTSPVPLTEIGTIIAGSGCQLRHADGSIVDLPALGWSHALS